MAGSSIEQLEEKVNSLSLLVERQAKLLAETGQQLVSLQVKDVKLRMSDLDAKKATGITHEDLEDFVTNEDIVQLVGELQGQLDAIEDRNIRRVFNSQLSEDGVISPVGNKNGELPEGVEFPKTLKDFTNIDNKSLIQLGVFYEYIVANEQIKDLSEFTQDESNDIEKTKEVLLNQSGSAHIENVDIELSEEDSNALFDDVSRYLGLKVRRNKDQW